MQNLKINFRFQQFTLQRIAITGIIRKCIKATFAEEKIDTPIEINVLITNDQGIRLINSTSRNIDKATDVLSFPMFDLEPGHAPDDWSDFLDPDTGRCPLGDMVISLERAIKQAEEFGHSPRREIGYLTIHSMLHLLGYDHLDEGEEKARMRKKEETIAASVPGVCR